MSQVEVVRSLLGGRDTSKVIPWKEFLKKASSAMGNLTHQQLRKLWTNESERKHRIQNWKKSGYSSAKDAYDQQFAAGYKPVNQLKIMGPEHQGTMHTRQGAVGLGETVQGMPGGPPVAGGMPGEMPGEMPGGGADDGGFKWTDVGDTGNQQGWKKVGDDWIQVQDAWRKKPSGVDQQQPAGGMPGGMPGPTGGMPGPTGGMPGSAGGMPGSAGGMPGPTGGMPGPTGGMP
ncbi:hypothetical protein, partial [uncultured Marinobacter sp.]|uniref:hypothetical protein n=1 Tax=uncultured Marinobacter sp. TaxID=187379 RepID=UPI0030DCD1A7